MRENRLAELRDLRKVNCQAFGVAFSFNMGHCLAFGVAFSVIMRHCSAFGVAFSVNVLDKKYQSDALSLLKYTIKNGFLNCPSGCL
jgi:hypothetical protein